MAWVWSDPPNVVEPDVEDEPVDYPDGHFFYIWHTDEPVTIKLSVIPDRYELRDWKGQILSTGNASAVVTLGIVPAGHYRLYFYNDGVDDPVYGNAAGAINIAVWRRSPGISDRPIVKDDSPLNSEAITSLSAIGATTIRHNITDATDVSYAVNDQIKPSKQLHDAYYFSYPNPLRAEKEYVIHFSDGTRGAGSDAGVAEVINEFGVDGVWYECRNEPDTNTSPEDFLPEMQEFHAMVKAANPNANVLGPNQVSINGNSLNWLRSFFQGGGGEYIDGFSFHAYNACSGELIKGRGNAERLIALLEEFGQQNKPRWMTEWGHFASTYGSYTPLRQVRWVMTEMLFWEQYGIPKERWYYFYNKSHGFWDYPSFIMTDKRGMLPTATAMRVFTEEVYAKAYSARLNFGDEDNDFLGSRYESAAGDLIALIACGRHGDSMRFKVDASLTELECVDTMGALSTIEVVNGYVTIAIDGTPRYIRIPHGMLFTPQPKEFGANLVRQGLWSDVVSSTGSGTATELIRAAIPPSYPYTQDGPLPVILTLTLGQMTSFNAVYIRGTQPWQLRSAILEGKIEVMNGSVWQEIGSISNDYTHFSFPVGWRDTNCATETYYNERFSWLVQLPQSYRSDKVRLIVTKATYGGEVEGVEDGSGQGLGYEALSLTSIEVYNVQEHNGAGVGGIPPSATAGPMVVVRKN